MKYLHTYSGRPSKMPTRQSKSVGRNACATISSDCASISLTVARIASSVSTFVTPFENALSGCFSTTGRPSVGTMSSMFSACTTSVFGHGILCRVEQLREIDLVRAFEDRVRIVDDDEPFRFRAARDAERVVVDRRRFADEQRVELRDAADVVLRDELDVEAEAFGRVFETLQRFLVRRRFGLGRIVQDREVVARLRTPRTRRRLPEK